jgi:hypothetical protein
MKRILAMEGDGTLYFFRTNYKAYLGTKSTMLMIDNGETQRRQ